MSLVTWLEDHILPCSFKSWFGVDCLGCGIQRAFILLLKGEYSASFYLYPALIPIILMLVLLVLHLVFKFKLGLKWLKYMFIFNVIIVLINYIIKFI